MTNSANPILGAWYRDLSQDLEFQVVAYDDIDGVVEIQYSDGDIDAMELDEWHQMDLESIEPPEDWPGRVDDEDDDSTTYGDIHISDGNWEHK